MPSPTTPPGMTSPPPAPNRNNSSVFRVRMDDFLAWLAAWVTQLADVATNVFGNAQISFDSAAASSASAVASLGSSQAAASSAQAAAASSGAIAWVSGTTYAAGDVRWSPADNRVYRRRPGTAGAGATDPNADATNWGLVAANGLQMISVAGTTQTAAVGGLYVLKNSAQSTLTAPPSPQPGDTFAVKVANGRTDNLVNWNGAKHEGISDATMSLDGLFMSRQFIYIDATIGWGII